MLRLAAELRTLHAQQEQQGPSADPRVTSSGATPAASPAAAALQAELAAVEQQIVGKTAELKRLQVRQLEYEHFQIQNVQPVIVLLVL